MTLFLRFKQIYMYPFDAISFNKYRHSTQFETNHCSFSFISYLILDYNLFFILTVGRYLSVLLCVCLKNTIA